MGKSKRGSVIAHTGKKGLLQAGAATVDITPEAGTHLAGSGMGDRRPAQSVLDPLYARAAVFELNGRKLCILAMDLCIITEQFTARIRRVAKTKFGFEPEAVMVHAIQTHSAPSCGCFMLDPDFPLRTTPSTEYLWGMETPYFERAVAGALQAIAQAQARLEPVKIAAGSAVKDRLAFNRRGITRDGSICMPWPAGSRQQPLGPTHLRYMEGPTDPEVAIFGARREDLSLVAMVLHHTCHPVNVFGDRNSYRSVSADWPGAWASAMQAAFPACAPLVLNGCCGNINPWDPFDPDFVMDHRRMGRELALTAQKVVGTLTFEDAVVLDWKTRILSLPYRDIPQARRVEVDKILAENPQPKWRTDGVADIDPQWFLAASTRSIDYLRQRNRDFFPYELQVMRVGDTAFVGLPGEPFVEGQLAIKIGSPAKTTIVAHCTSHYVGYVPTRDGAARGGHEANPECTYWAKLAPGALDIIVAEVIGMLKEVFR